MDTYYVTTACPYPNGNPHIGHATEWLQGDFFARYYRLAGKDVRFMTGIDVHGLKIQRTAEAAGMGIPAFLQEKEGVFKGLAERLRISNDIFLRTDNPDHEKLARAFWRACLAKGDIYKKKYRAWYDVKEEDFLGLVDEYPDPSVFGVDPKFVEMIDEENYFFAQSKYEERIIEILTSGRYTVVPESRLTELLNFVREKGLQDVSISREKSKLEWGVPVPGDPGQVMYVWFDALTYYLTAASRIDESGAILPDGYWPVDLHVVGKDIARFHALLWPTMLLSAGIELPRELLVHGFFTSGGKKMSKSVGNVVDPFEVMDAYGTDAFRWYCLHELPTTGDADYTDERMRQTYMADLANDYGNLVSRVWTMCQKYCGGKVPMADPHDEDNAERMVTAQAWDHYHAAVERRRIDEALSAAHSLLTFCNKRIDEYKPWVMAKDEYQAEKLAELLYELLEVIRHVTLMVSPALVGAAPKVASGVFVSVPAELWTSFELGSKWGGLVTGSALGSEQPILFPRLEVAS